jgi:hypothetical protein
MWGKGTLKRGEPVGAAMNLVEQLTMLCLYFCLTSHF